MQGRIAFVPEVLPIAPRPIPGELISSWLLRVSFANGLTLPQLIEAIETRFPGLSLRSAFIDDRLSPGARFALAKFMRLPEDKVKAHELAQQFPMLPPEWILRPTECDPGSPDRFAQGRARYAFCPLCLQEMIFRARTVWIRSEWAFVFQTRLSLDVSFRTIGVAGQPFDEELEDTARFLVSAVHSILEMTKRQFRYKILRVAVVLALYAILGVFLYGHSQHSKNHLYPIYKDLMSLIIAIAASYLGFAYQRRQSYLQALRDLWNRLIPAVYRAVECARNDQPASSQFSEVIRELDTVIDSLRGVFENIPNGTALGLYPYEPLKDIRTLVYWLSEGRNAEERHLAERCIRQLWYDVHSRMLQEFDREVPIYYVSKYLDVPPLSIADKLIKGMSLRGDLRD